MPSRPTPRPVVKSMGLIGEFLREWRLLRHLRIVEVADRAALAPSTVQRLEHGEGASLENILRVARALGILDQVVKAWDPFETDVGRLRAGQALPQRVRHPKPRY